jgi:hypothetical protein
MASEKDLKHFENIKTGMAQLELESLKKEMAMTSGERILAAIRMSDAKLKWIFGGQLWVLEIGNQLGS